MGIGKLVIGICEHIQGAAHYYQVQRLKTAIDKAKHEEWRNEHTAGINQVGQRNQIKVAYQDLYHFNKVYTSSS